MRGPLVPVAAELPALDRTQFTFLGRHWTVGLANEASLWRSAELATVCTLAGNWVRQPNVKLGLECERVMMELQGTRAKVEVDINVEHTQAMIAVIGSLQPEEGAELLAEAMEQAALADEARKLLPPGKP